MGKIEDAIWQLLKSTLTNESVCSFGSFAIGGGSLPTGNLYEITANDVEATVKKYGKIALSPYYPTVREKDMAQQYDSKLQSAKQQYEDRYNAEINAKEETNRSLNNSLISVQKECTKLQKAIAERDKIIAQKNSEITNLKGQIKQIGQNQEAVKNINLIKAPIIELAKILGNQRTHGCEENIKQKKENLFSIKGLISIANLAILLIILIVALSILFKVSTKGNKPVDPLENLQDSTSILNRENEKLKGQPSPYDNENISAGQDVNPFSSEATSTSARIDVTNYDEAKETYLQKNTECHATVLDCPDPDNGTWSISGGSKIDNAKGEHITFVPNSDNVRITFTNQNGEMTSRSLIVQ